MLASPGPRGLSDVDPSELGTAALACWDAFLEVVTAPSTDLTRPSRLPGWSGRDTCLHLGAWPEHRPLTSIVASAREGGEGTATDPDDHNASILRAHADATVEEVVQALHDARAATAAFFAGPEPAEVGRMPSGSTLGPLPVLSVVHAAAYELAVHALDLAPCGAPAPAAHLLDRGLAALVDVTGALAARAGVAITLTAQAPDTGWRFASDATGWTTTRTDGGPFRGTGVRGTTADLLDASAGRNNLPQLLLTRRMVVQDLPSWMRLAPLLHEVPGLPGGAVLKGAVSGLGRVTGVLGRFRR